MLPASILRRVPSFRSIDEEGVRPGRFAPSGSSGFADAHPRFARTLRALQIPGPKNSVEAWGRAGLSGVLTRVAVGGAPPVRRADSGWVPPDDADDQAVQVHQRTSGGPAADVSHGCGRRVLGTTVGCDATTLSSVDRARNLADLAARGRAGMARTRIRFNAGKRGGRTLDPLSDSFQ